MSLWDAYTTGKTLLDPCAGLGEKSLAAGLFLGGIVAPGNYGWADDAAKSASSVLKFPNAGAVQKFFTKAGHGAELGLKGNWNPSQASATRSAINQFVNSPGVKTIQGVYRGIPVTHYVNPTTGMNIMADQTGNFAGGWKLGVEQLESVLNSGRLW